MSVTSQARKAPLWLRLFMAVPIVGWATRDLLYGDKDNIWYALITFVSLWAISAMTFGLPGLYLPALALVPVIFVVLILITWD